MALKKVPFYTYSKIITSESSYGKRMTRLRNSIFGEPLRPSQHIPKNYKTVRVLSREPVNRRDEVANWYPRHRETHSLMMALREYGLFRDEHEDFKEEMIRLRTLRGKPPWNPKEKNKDKKK
ncbi:28S ribosomal protein S33, mitochondrial [Folsomia candida]|uniref:Small ribosomal subunit protein mS33 n=1 Tax=Folsomia candida TaxID=158441 RepID=A0A226DGD9_FOLCA|nr:28S ribosomal protein S33, mitochondrial [Folsomia candida]OXA43661.1 hypothetical protein Fcan01_21674 [Folsomia candida]